MGVSSRRLRQEYVGQINRARTAGHAWAPSYLAGFPRPDRPMTATPRGVTAAGSRWSGLCPDTTKECDTVPRRSRITAVGWPRS
jgi:hypothetical protein